MKKGEAVYHASPFVSDCHGGARAPAYVQRIDRTPVQMTTNRKLALMMGKITAEDAASSPCLKSLLMRTCAVFDSMNIPKLL
jgi:hypothetical protein